MKRILLLSSCFLLVAAAAYAADDSTMTTTPVKKGGIDPINIPAAIKVIRDLLRRDEAPINVDRAAPSGS